MYIQFIMYYDLCKFKDYNYIDLLDKLSII